MSSGGISKPIATDRIRPMTSADNSQRVKRQMAFLAMLYGPYMELHNGPLWVFLCGIPAKFAAVSDTARRQNFYQRAFDWTSQRDEIREFLAAKHGDEQWFSVNMFRSDKRAKGNALARLWAYLDADEGTSLDNRQFRPTVAYRTSDNNFQTYYFMGEPGPGELDSGGVNQRLTYHLGADSGGWFDTKIMRVPLSIHSKPDEAPTEVGDWKSYPSTVHTWDSFREKLPELPATEIEADTEIDWESVDTDAVRKRIRSLVPQWALERLRDNDTGDADRSNMLIAIDRELALAGCSTGEIIALTKDSVWNKYEGRSDELKQLRVAAQKAAAKNQAKAMTDNMFEDEYEDDDERLTERTEHHKLEIRAKRIAYQELDSEGTASEIEELPGIMTLPELEESDMETTDFRVDRVWSTGGNLLLVARPKAGKTERAMELGKCLVTGEPYLDEYEVRKINGNFLFVNYELTPRMAAQWLRDMDIPTDKFLILNLRGLRFPIMSDDGMEWLVDRLNEFEVEATIFDPFARMLTAAGINDENDNNVVKNVCARLDEIKSATNVSELGVAAHASRFDVICRPRGGDALIGWMDNQISLEFKTRETNKGSRYFSTIGRDTNSDKRFELKYDKDKRHARILHDLTLYDPDNPDFGKGGRGRSVDEKEYDARVKEYMTMNPEATQTNAANNIVGTKSEIVKAYKRWKSEQDLC